MNPYWIVFMIVLILKIFCKSIRKQDFPIFIIPFRWSDYITQSIINSGHLIDECAKALLFPSRFERPLLWSSICLTINTDLYHLWCLKFWRFKIKRRFNTYKFCYSISPFSKACKHNVISSYITTLLLIIY